MIESQIPSRKELDARSLRLRKKIVKMLEGSRRGHLGAACSLVEILRVLYDDILQYNPRVPDWEGRDRFVLSKGHGCLALYVILSEKEFFPEKELFRFCKSGALLGGHPEHKIPGVEVSTGSLGHGLSLSVGFALSARIRRKGFRVFVVLGDGESNEGSVWEAAMSAGKHGLERLTVIVDYNKHASYGPLSAIQPMEPFVEKWRSFGFGVDEINGHDIQALKRRLSTLPIKEGKPSAVICHTIKGKGFPFAENDVQWHHKSRITDEEMQRLNHALERS